MLTAKHIDTASATGKIDHLLPCDFTGRHTDSLTLYTMIASQQQMARMSQRRRKRLLNQTYLHSQFLQTAQRTLWLIQIVNLFLYLGA
jgi:hypothetical protein